MFRVKIDGTLQNAGIIRLKPYPNLQRSNSPTAESLEADSVRFRIQSSSDLRQLAYGTEIIIYDDATNPMTVLGKFYSSDVSRVEKDCYEITAVSIVGVLLRQNHDGGVYAGETAGSIIADIMGDLPYSIDADVAATIVYGWLPDTAVSNNMSARDNLKQVLFAVGAYALKDANGGLRFTFNIQSTAYVIPDSRTFISEVKEKRISATSVTIVEHAYYQSAASALEEVYDTQGVVVTAYKVVFSEPHHSYSSSTLTIVDSDANWAIVTGTGKLQAKKYIHATREIKRVLDANAPDRNVSVSRATLVSPFNSVGILERMANYYGNAVQRQFEIVASGEKAGDLIRFNNRYGESAQGYISEMTETFSSIDRARVTAITDWTPVEPGNDYDEYLIIRQADLTNGRWDVPTRLRQAHAMIAVFGGSYGGRGGWYGGTGPDSFNFGNTGYQTKAGIKIGNPGTKPTAALKGGLGGEGGGLGRMLQFNIENLASYYNASFGDGGVGGDGGTVSRERLPRRDRWTITMVDPTEGSIGEASSFGGYSTNDGVDLRGADYLNLVTGEKIAGTGPTGIAGGDGGLGANAPQYVVNQNSAAPLNIAASKGSNGENVGNNSGGAGAYGFGGISTEDEDGDPTGVAPYSPSLGGYVHAPIDGGCGGGGAAFGSNGGAAHQATRCEQVNGAVGSYMYGEPDYFNNFGYGGTGATATAPEQATDLNGGAGGNGGGGGGQAGQPLGFREYRVSGNDYYTWGMNLAGLGGNGSKGGKGSRGWAIAYLKAQELLPSGYTALEYISSSGQNGPRIDTGINSDSVVEIVAESEVTNRNQVWINRSDASTGDWFGVESSNGKWIGGVVDGTTKARCEVLITATEMSGKVNGNAFRGTYTATVGEIVLCNVLTNNYGVTGKLYRAIITTNGKTVWFGIPAKNSSDVAGLYDLIGNAFYPSSNSTAFVAGPEK